MPSWLAACAIDGSTTPSTNGLSAPSTTAQAPERSTISTARPGTSTNKPYAPWATDSSASCTGAYATTPTTANTPRGRTEPPPRLDDLQPWDVYNRDDNPDENMTNSLRIDRRYTYRAMLANRDRCSW